MSHRIRIPVTRPSLDEEECRGLLHVLASRWISQGPEVERFERAVADYLGVPYAVAMSSCTLALQIALELVGVGEGDEVILPSFTFIATANAVRHRGARPVFADIDPGTLNLRPEEVEARMTARTRAVIAVHQFGLPAEIDTIQEICERNRIAFVQDAACALGSVYKGEKVGRRGPVSCFSFHPRKVITTGEGGMLVTHDKARAERARTLRSHGASVSDYQRHQATGTIVEAYHTPGHNARMTDLQAAVGRAQMQKLPGILERRRALAEQYTRALRGIPGLTPPGDGEGRETNYQSYCLRVGVASPFTRDELMVFLLERSIASRRGCHAIHLEPAYRDLSRDFDLPVTERAAAESVILPLYPDMSLGEQEEVVRAVEDLCRRKGTPR